MDYTVFEDSCGKMNDYSIKFSKNLAQMCSAGVSPIAFEEFAVNTVCM